MFVSTRARVIRQLLTESIVLSIAGGIVGLLLGAVGVRGLLAISPGNVPRVEQIAAEGASVFSALDWRVVAFTFAVSLLAGVWAAVGALIVSFVRTAGIQFFPEIELAVLYLIAAAVLIVRPTGLFGRT